MILAEMIRSAVAWELENGTPRKTPDRNDRKGVDRLPGPYTLSTHSGATRQQEPEEGEES